jgi:AcrR family transcriptional regulator
LEGVASAMGEPGRAGPARGRDTRARIQAVAIELFTEQGYEKTSLREIADRLGVTKAALYYHFRSKEDIVASLTEDYLGQIDELIAWGRAQPAGPATRDEVLRRYVTLVADGHQVFQMLHKNQAAWASQSGHKGRSELFKERLGQLAGLLAEPDAPLAGRLRAAMTLGGISVAWMYFADEVPDTRALCAAVLGVARDLAGDGALSASALSASTLSASTGPARSA